MTKRSLSPRVSIRPAEQKKMENHVRVLDEVWEMEANEPKISLFISYTFICSEKSFYIVFSPIRKQKCGNKTFAAFVLSNF